MELFGRLPILATVFAIGLTACSSRDDGSASATDPDPGATAGQQELAALQQQAAALRRQLGLTDDGDLGDSIDSLIAERDRLQQQIDDAAEAEALRVAAEMAALAAKLYLGIGTTPFGGTGTDPLSVAYPTAGGIELRVGAFRLLEDEDAPVDANHGWEGRKFMRVLTGEDPALDGLYDAVVYSNVGDPTQGARFNSGTGAGNVGFATTGGVLMIADSTNVATRIVSPSFDHGAGSRTFHFPDPRPRDATTIGISGSYYGVEGTYACTPAVAADGCRVERAADGYTLVLTGDGSGAWTFTAADPDDRVTVIVPNTEYVSYGWWTQKSPYGGDYGFVRAFIDDWDDTDPVPAATGIAALRGTATYSGGAAGIDALSSLTGGINDGGAFTAAATLEAGFHDDMISGTIDNFVGADGQPRDWSLELTTSGIGDTGTITGADGTGDPVQTVWTLGGTAADAGGQWSGTLYDNDTGGVPKVAAGTFHATYGHEGRMVGAFGTTRQ